MCRDLCKSWSFKDGCIMATLRLYSRKSRNCSLCRSGPSSSSCPGSLSVGKGADLQGLARLSILPKVASPDLAARRKSPPSPCARLCSTPLRPHPRTDKMLLASILTVTCLLASSTQALYFYIDGTTPKCFYEELPKDTLVVGQ